MPLAPVKVVNILGLHATVKPTSCDYRCLSPNDARVNFNGAISRTTVLVSHLRD